MLGNRFKLKLGLILFMLFWETGLGLWAQVLRNPAQPYIEAGDKLFEQGKFKEALSAYEQALAIDPKNQYVAFQIILLNVKISSGEKPFPATLPARDYSKLGYELGPYYKDPLHKFALKYPKGWLLDNTDPYFNVKMIDPYYEAFIFVKVIPVSQPVQISYEFQAQVENLVKNLTAQIPGASLKYCNFEKLVETIALRVEVHYRAGPNNVIINSRILTELDRVVIVSWVTQEKLLPYFRAWLESSVGTITLNPQ